LSRRPGLKSKKEIIIKGLANKEFKGKRKKKNQIKETLL
jgi:hypothetical protein